MEEGANYRDILEKHRVDIIKYLELEERQFLLSYLRSNFVLDDEDCQIIAKTGTSRQQKVAKFIDILSTKGPDGFNHFVEALEFEHPHLFEMFTGKKGSTSCHNFLSKQSVIPYAIVADKMLLDFDRQYLVQELEKSTATAQSMAYMQSKMTKEKTLLENQVRDLQIQMKERDELVEELTLEINLKDKLISSKENSQELKNAYLQSQSLLIENAEKSQLIIALQAQMLASKGDNEGTSRVISELTRKNENLMQQVKDLTIGYDWQRQRSNRLSEQVDQNKTELRKVCTVNRKIHELKFELLRVKEERDDAERKVKEFRSAVTELNVSYDMLQQQQYSEAEQRGQFSQESFQLKDKIHHLQQQLNIERSKTEKCKQKNEFLLKEIETYKEQRYFFLQERENAIRDLEQALKAKDDAEKFNRQLQKSRNDAVRKHIDISAQYESKLAESAKVVEKNEEDFEKFRRSVSKDEIKSTKVEEATFTDKSLIVTSSKTEDIVAIMNRYRNRCDTEILKATRTKLSNATCLTNSQERVKILQILSDKQSNSLLAETFPASLFHENSKTSEEEEDETSNNETPKRLLSRQPAIRNTKKTVHNTRL